MATLSVTKGLAVSKHKRCVLHNIMITPLQPPSVELLVGCDTRAQHAMFNEQMAPFVLQPAGGGLHYVVTHDRLLFMLVARYIHAWCFEQKFCCVVHCLKRAVQALPHLCLLATQRLSDSLHGDQGCEMDLIDPRTMPHDFAANKIGMC